MKRIPDETAWVAQVKEIHALRAQGASWTQICFRLRISQGRLARALRDYNPDGSRSRVDWTVGRSCRDECRQLISDERMANLYARQNYAGAA